MTHFTKKPKRPDRAKKALAVFTAGHFSEDNLDSMTLGELHFTIIDLMADLLHFAHQLEFDCTYVSNRAFAHFETEVREEEDRS